MHNILKDNPRGGKIKQLMLEPMVHSLLFTAAAIVTAAVAAITLCKSPYLHKKILGFEGVFCNNGAFIGIRNAFTYITRTSANVLSNPREFTLLYSLIALAALVIAILWVINRKLANGSAVPISVIQNSNIRGKNVIITGANTGIGYATALQLYHLGAHIVLACRNYQRGSEAAQKIKTDECPNNIPSNKRCVGSVRYMNLDLSSHSSIIGFANSIEKDNIKIHILVNNAGIMALPKPKFNSLSLEYQFAVNHIGPFALTNLLLENLVKNNAKIINTSSLAHCLYMQGKGYFDTCEVEESYVRSNYNANRSYGISKLCNLLFTRKLQERLNATSQNPDAASTYALHPGCVKTQLARYMVPDPQKFTLQQIFTALYPSTLIYRLFYNIVNIYFNIFLQTPHYGSATTVYLCLEEKKNLIPGGYYAECCPGYITPAAADSKFADALWNYSAQCVSKYK